jgi:hypothetical protein
MASPRLAVTLALASLVFATATSDAAPPKPASPSNIGISSIDLLALETVQAELGLNEEQRAKLVQVRQKLHQKLQSVVTGEADYSPARDSEGADGDDEEQVFVDHTTRMLEQLNQLDTDAQQVLAALLTDAQQRRLRQLNLQARDASALSDPDVTRSLRLTSRQQQHLAQIRKEVTQRRLSLLRELQDASSRERAQKLQQLRSEERQAQIAVLTEAQRNMFQQMMGRKIALDRS